MHNDENNTIYLSYYTLKANLISLSLNTYLIKFMLLADLKKKLFFASVRIKEGYFILSITFNNIKIGIN